MKAGDILASARVLLTDPDGTRWTDDVLLRWLNAGQRQICVVRPDAKAVRVDLVLQEGVEQRILDGGWKLLGIQHNVKADGTRGRAVTLITRDELDTIDLHWPTVTGREETRHYVVDGDDPCAYDVWPPAVEGGKLRGTIAGLPKDCKALDDPIDLSDVYGGPLIDWVCFRAYNQDSDDPQDAGHANTHLQAFTSALTAGAQANDGTAPRRK